MHAHFAIRRHGRGFALLNLTTLTLAALALAALALGAAAPVAAGGSVMMPQDTQARMYRSQAQQNRQLGSRQAAAPAAGSGYGGLDPVAGGTGNLSIGGVSQSNSRNLREVNTYVNGDIINLNKGH